MKRWQQTAALWTIFVGTACAHIVSLSNGELRIIGRAAEYTLHMPAYEIEHVEHPGEALLRELRFGDGRRISSECAREGDDFVCHAKYAFDHDLPDKIEVECTLYRATVPNHIHMLYAVQGENADQRVFDQNTSVIEMRFHPPSFWESLTRDGSAGAIRFLTSFAAVLFLLVVAVAANTWREALKLGALFLVAEWLVRPLVPFLPVGLSAEFLEAMMALTAAYLAGEVLFLPEGRARWAIVPILGLVHGLPFVAFPALYLAGAELTQASVLAILTIAILRVPRSWRKTSAAVCLLAALAWFARFVVA